MRLSKNIIATFIFALFVNLFALVPLTSAEPAPELPKIVSTTRSDWTPTIYRGNTFPDPEDRQIWHFDTYHNGIVFACGKFDKVRERSAEFTSSANAGGIFAFYQSGTNRGKLTSFRPIVKDTNDPNGLGEVNVCKMSYDGTSLIIGGKFNSVAGYTSVGGKPIRNLAKISLTGTNVGKPQPFAYTDGQVSDITKAKNMYFVSGAFNTINTTAQTGIATINQDGSTNSYFNAKLTGQIGPEAGPTKAGVCTTDTGEHYLTCAINASAVDGKPRKHIAVWNLGTALSLRDWQLYRANVASCQRFMVIHDIQPVPGTYDAVLVSTGGNNGGICDATIRFPLNGIGSSVKDTWTNYTSGDTLHAVQVTSNNVYAQGHQKYSRASPSDATLLPRYGIMALATANGKLIDKYNGYSITWRSDQPKCDGGKALMIINQTGYEPGLLSGLDCDGTDAAASPPNTFTGTVIFRSAS